MKNKKRSTLRMIFQLLLGAILLYAGISHLTFNRTEFLAQVPDWLPMNKDLVVVLSGLVEITLGASLIILQKFKIWVGFATALFFILIFPGNIAQYVNGINSFGLDTDKARAIRLLFQPVLVVWALWSTNAYYAWKHRNS